MSDPKRSPQNPAVAGRPSGDSEKRPTYEAPSLVEVGTLRDLTAAGSFGDPT